MCAAFGWDPWQAIVWHADNDKAAARVLAHRFPNVPNLGDITTVDWATVPPVEVLIGGTPCQDLSHAGRRGGMKEGTRSNLWVQMREAVAVLTPRMVIWENVMGALSADADSEMEPCAGCVGDGAGEPVLRALGRVCGDLSTLGYDSQWITVPASAVGACHRRERVFLIAYPADTSIPEWGVSQREHLGTGPSGTAKSGERTSTSPWSVGVASHADSATERERRIAAATETAGGGARPDTGRSGGARTVAYSQNDGCQDSFPGRSHEAQPRTPLAAESDANTTSNGRDEGRPEPAGIVGGSDASFGSYAPAVERWEHILGRPAPAPTTTGQRGARVLNPAFVEWMMGLPAGWVTAVPGISRNDKLRILGNGVVPQQCAYALQLLTSSHGTD